MSNNNIVKKDNKSLLIGSMIVVIMAILPYAFYYYEAIPEWITSSTLFSSLSESFDDNHFMASWVLIQKIIPLTILIVWFLTCKHWWYHVIIIPMSLYVFQLYNIFDFKSTDIDSGELYFIVPVVVVSLSLTYLARIKVFDKINGIDISEIEDGIKKPSDRLFK